MSEYAATHHLARARELADAAEDLSKAEPETAARLAAISQAHSAAAVATMVVEGYVDVRTTEN